MNLQTCPNVLLDIAAGYDFAVGFKKTFQSLGYSLHCAPGVLAELNVLTSHDDENVRQRAGAVMDNLILWDISPIALTDVERTYRKNFMDFVEDRRILPPKERNDARILADTAIANIPMLVTSDSGILEADQTELAFAFDHAGLPRVATASPRKLWSIYAKAARPGTP